MYEVFCGYFSGWHKIQFYVKVLYTTRLSSGQLRLHWVVSERARPLTERVKTFSLSGGVFMKFSNNVLPFRASPKEAHNIFRNVLSILFLDVLEIGDHTFTARLCHRGQVFKERARACVCVWDFGITKKLGVWSNEEFERLVMVLVKIPVLWSVKPLKEYPSYKCCGIRYLSWLFLDYP